MAKLSKEEIEEIIKQEYPGYRVVETTGAVDALSSPAKADERTPDIDALITKYRKAAPNPGPGDEESTDAESREAVEAEEDQMVTIEPETPPNPWDHGSRPKSVIISAKDKKIIASQG